MFMPQVNGDRMIEATTITGCGRKK